MNQHSQILRLLVLLLFLLVGCSTAIPPDTPPDIRYGADICDECNMIIDDARFAAAYTTTTGDVRRFDDIGDMLVHSQQHQEEVHIYWVHDYETTDWINADQAVFVLSPNLTTPMAWGLAAFAEPGAAEAFSHDNQGHMTNFRDLWADMESGALDPETINVHAHDGPAGESQHNMEMESMNHNHQTEPADGG